MEAKTTIQKTLKSEGWYRWRFLTPHVRYWMWRLRSQRERGEEKGYSTVKWLISPVPCSFHPNIGFLLTFLRNKDIKAKIGRKSDESFKNIFITTMLKWTSIQFAFWQRFCTFLTQRETHADWCSRAADKSSDVTRNRAIRLRQKWGASGDKIVWKKFQRVVEFYSHLSKLWE